MAEDFTTLTLNGHQLSSVCKLHTLLADVQSLPTNSASPTDVSIAHFRPGVRQLSDEGDGKESSHELKAGFLKWFVRSGGHRRQHDEIQGLIYEMRVYRHVTNQLLRHHICPFFVNYLGSSTDCNLFDIFQIFRKSKILERHAAPQIRQALNRTALKLVRQEERTELQHEIRELAKLTQTLDVARPFSVLHILLERFSPLIFRSGDRVTEPESDLKDELMETASQIQDADQVQIGLLVTELGGERLVDLFRQGFQFTRATVDRDTELLRHIYFQVSIMLYAQELSGLAQNDLHPGNVLYDSQGIDTTFQLGDKGEVFHYKAPMLLHGYDYDRSYVKFLGSNSAVTPRGCSRISQCNSFVPNKDLLKFSCYIFRLLFRRQRAQASDPRGTDHIKAVIEGLMELLGLDVPKLQRLLADQRCFLRESKLSATLVPNPRRAAEWKTLPDSFFQEPGIQSPLQVAQTLMTKWKETPGSTVITEAMTDPEWICIPERFGPQGRVLVNWDRS